MALHSLGDDISPRSPRPSLQRDVSMHEDLSDDAEDRRRQARQEILQRGRVMEERRRRRASRGHVSGDSITSMGSVSILDEDVDKGAEAARTTAVHATDAEGTMTQRQPQSNRPTEHDEAEATFETRYEREMRESWNLELPPHHSSIAPTALQSPSTHASESLLDLTPTSENAPQSPPDPDYSIPSLNQFRPPQSQSEYFSAASSTIFPPLSQQTIPQVQPQQTQRQQYSPEDPPEYYYAHPSTPQSPLPELRTLSPRPHTNTNANADPLTNPIDNHTSIASVASTSSLLALSQQLPHHSYHGDTDTEADDSYSEIDHDGLRTPASSAWTDVGSVVSEDF